MDGNDKFLQQMAYSAAFGNIILFIVNELPLENCFREIIEANIINADSHIIIVNERDVNRKKHILVQHLQQVNNVGTYNKFIMVCDKVNTRLADFIRKEIAKEIRKVGLSAEYDPPARSVSVANEPPVGLTVTSQEKPLVEPNNTLPSTRQKVDAITWMQVWSQKLRENSISIVSFLNLDNGARILIQLVCYGVLTKHEEDEINTIRTKKEKNFKFLEIIQQKEWTEIPIIIAAIRETQKPMADIIEELYSRALQESMK